MRVYQTNEIKNIALLGSAGRSSTKRANMLHLLLCWNAPSMKSIGEVEGRADTVLDALIEYFKDGLLLLPTHNGLSLQQHQDET